MNIKTKTTKWISLISAITLFSSNIIPFFPSFSTHIHAESKTKDSIGSINMEDDGVTIGVDENQTQKTTYSNEIEQEGTQDAKVYVSQASSFGVFIPKILTLDGKKNDEGINKANYLVSVSESSNFAGNEKIKVVPEDSFVLHQLGKEDIQATVVQDKVEWLHNEIDIKGNGEVTATGMSAGSWNGVFYFNIKLENDSNIVTPNTISLSEKELMLGSGDTRQVNATMNGQNINTLATWTSDNENILVEDGLIETKASAQVGDKATIEVFMPIPSEHAKGFDNLFLKNVYAEEVATASLVVEVIDIQFTTLKDGQEEIITSIDIQPNSSKQVTAKVITTLGNPTVSWSTTAISGVNLVKNGNEVTIKIASDMPIGSTHNVVANCGNLSKLLTINVVENDGNDNNEPGGGTGEHVCEYTPEVLVNPTCENKGTTKYTCDCNKSYTLEDIDKLGHNFEEEYKIDIPPTCTTEGSKSQHCTRCGAKQNITPIDKLEHNFEDGICSCGARENIFELSEESLNLGIGTTKQINATLNGKNINDIVTWTSNNENIKVNNGLIEITNKVNVGDVAIIEVSMPIENSEETITKSLTINIIDIVFTVNDEEISSVNVVQGQSVEIKATVFPTTNTTPIMWEKNNSELNISNQDENIIIVNVPTDIEIGKEIFIFAKTKDYNKPIKISIVENNDDHNHKYQEYIQRVDKEWTLEPPTTTYTFELNTSNNRWYSNNKGKNNTTATATWTFNVKEEVEWSVFYGVSSQASDKLSLKLDNETILTGLGGNYNSGYTTTKTLSPGKHTFIASFYKDGSGAANNDKAFVQLAPIKDIVSTHKCIYCDKQEEHSFVETIDVPKTCTTNGIKKYTCECGYYYTEEIPMSHEYIDNSCKDCGKLIAGAYDENDVLLADWKELTETYGYNPTYTYTASTYKTSANSGYYVLNNKEQLKTTTKIVFPDTVTTIGNYNLAFCSNLKEIELTNNIISIGNYAFFGNTKLEKIEISNKITTINAYTFANCSSLKTIDLPNDLTTISNNAFQNCTALESINFNNSLKTIGNYAFDNCNRIETIELTNNITSLGTYCFSNCSNLKEIKFSENITGVNGYLFYNCTSLEKIELPNKISGIGEYAFSGCSNLKEISYPISSSIVSNTFKNIGSLEKINLLKGTGVGYTYSTSTTKYTPWYIYSNRNLQITLEEGITSIGNYTFLTATGIKNIILPNSLQTIGISAFSGCTGISSLYVPDSVTSIGNYAFGNIPVVCYDGMATGSPWAAGSIHKVTFNLVKGPTCDTNGYYEGTCEVCNKYLTKPIDMLGHELIEELFCTRCNEYIPSGLYTKDGFLLASWTELEETYGLDLEKNSHEGTEPILSTSDSDDEREFYTLWRIKKYNNNLANGKILVIDDKVNKLGIGILGQSGLDILKLGKNTILQSSSLGYTGYEMIYIAEGNDRYVRDEQALYNKEKTSLYKVFKTEKVCYYVPENITRIEGFAFVGNKFGSLKLPDSLNYLGVRALNGLGLTSIYIPYCTIDTSLDIEFENGYVYSGDLPFEECKDLTLVYFEDESEPASLRYFDNDFWKYTGTRDVSAFYGMTRDEVRDMTNKYHTLELREVLPKCEEQGYTEHYCSVCDAVIHISDYVEPTGHPLKDGYEILESPTCSNPGIGHGDCSICGKTNVDGPLTVPHTYKNGVCEICGYKDSETIIIDTTKFTSREISGQITSKVVTIDYKNGAEINATAQFEASSLSHCEYMKSNYLKVKYAFKVYDAETKTYNTIKEYYQTLKSTSYDMRIEEDIKINVELEPGTYTFVVSFVDTTTNAFVQMNSLNIEVW